MVTGLWQYPRKYCFERPPAIPGRPLCNFFSGIYYNLKFPNPTVGLPGRPLPAAILNVAVRLLNSI